MGSKLKWYILLTKFSINGTFVFFCIPLREREREKKSPKLWIQLNSVVNSMIIIIWMWYWTISYSQLDWIFIDKVWNRLFLLAFPKLAARLNFNSLYYFNSTCFYFFIFFFVSHLIICWWTIIKHFIKHVRMRWMKVQPFNLSPCCDFADKWLCIWLDFNFRYWQQHIVT